MKSFNLKIVSLDEIIYDGLCESLRLPTDNGYYGIQYGFNSSIMSLSEGIINVQIEEKNLQFKSKIGIAITENNMTTVILNQIY